MKIKIVLTMVYLAGVVFTFGFAYQDELRFLSECSPRFKLSNRCDAQMTGFICAALWPIYWPLHASKLMWGEQ